MKKSIALFLSVFYLIFSFGSLRAEASLLENKETQENVFSVKQYEENAVNHFAESPSPQKKTSINFDRNVLSAVSLASPALPAEIPLFLKHCNFRR